MNPPTGSTSDAFPPTPPIWRHPEFAAGAREMSGIAVGIAAWGLVTGVAMAKSGMGLAMALFMSVLVFAGSAQLAVLPLVASGAPLWVVWATALCVNLRFVLFSAAWRPYVSGLSLGQRLRVAYFTADLNYVMFMRRFPDPTPSPAQMPYFWGGSLTNWTSWQVSSIAGILLADAIPPTWGVGFAGTLALLGLSCALLTDRSTALAAAVAAGAAVATHALPLRLNIVVAIVAALGVGMMLEPRRAPDSAGLPDRSPAPGDADAVPPVQGPGGPA